MKTLRLFRNIAALFILGAGLLVSRPGVGVLHASSGKGKSCGYKKGGSVCYVDASGNCHEEIGCGGKSGWGCPNVGCV